eukprot:g75263.t1
MGYCLSGCSCWADVGYRLVWFFLVGCTSLGALLLLPKIKDEIKQHKQKALAKELEATLYEHLLPEHETTR